MGPSPRVWVPVTPRSWVPRPSHEQSHPQTCPCLTGPREGYTMDTSDQVDSQRHFIGLPRTPGCLKLSGFSAPHPALGLRSGGPPGAAGSQASPKAIPQLGPQPRLGRYLETNRFPRPRSAPGCPQGPFRHRAQPRSPVERASAQIPLAVSPPGLRQTLHSTQRCGLGPTAWC